MLTLRFKNAALVSRVGQMAVVQPFVPRWSEARIAWSACGWDLVHLRVGVGRVADCSKRRDMRCFGAADAAETRYILQISTVFFVGRMVEKSS